MRVFLTGGSGYIGTYVIDELLSAGHTVAVLARRPPSQAKLAAKGDGVTVVHGDLSSLDVLASNARTADAVLHLAYIHDFSQMENNTKIDIAAIEAMGEAMALDKGQGTTKTKTIIVASGMTGEVPKGEKRLALETDLPDVSPTSFGRFRGSAENATVALNEKGVRAMVVRLPPTVHGDEDTAFIPALIGKAREKGYAAYVGDGSNTWPSVHVRDAARLFVAAIAEGPAGSRLHAAGDEAIAYKDIAGAIAKGLSIETRSVPASRAGEEFGFASFITAKQCGASSELTRKWTGWAPREKGLLADILEGEYLKKGSARWIL